MSNPATILLVDDEEAVQKLLAYPLERDGYRVVQARDGDEALRQLRGAPGRPRRARPHAPEARRARGLQAATRRQHVPIIMLTARDDEVDKVLGLELGADDYITKPFSIREFRSRVKAALRRAAAPSTTRDGQEAISIDGLVVDPSRRAVEMNGAPVELTYVEFELLSALASKPGRVYSRQALLVALWGDSDVPRPSHDRRPCAPSPREARAESERPGVHPHGTRRRLPLPRRVNPLRSVGARLASRSALRRRCARARLRRSRAVAREPARRLAAERPRAERARSGAADRGAIRSSAEDFFERAGQRRRTPASSLLRPLRTRAEWTMNVIADSQGGELRRHS